VFAEREPARAYVNSLLESEAHKGVPTDKLAEVVKGDASLSELRRLVVLEELEWEVRRREAEKKLATVLIDPASTQPSATTTRPVR
jgi:hypothetical protein